MNTYSLRFIITIIFQANKDNINTCMHCFALDVTEIIRLSFFLTLFNALNISTPGVDQKYFQREIYT